MTNIAVLITCFNRRAKTIACLEALFANRLLNGLQLVVFLVDDGSIDGTSVAVLSKFPAVRIIQGNGNLYWGGGMRLAFAEALKQDFDYYLWLNDDTILYSDAIVRLFQAQKETEMLSRNGVIIVGTTRDSMTGKPTYGGQRRSSSGHNLRFDLVTPSDRPIPCDTINGNFVLISRVVAFNIGNLDQVFVHSMGDIDYGLRAVKAGYQLWVMPGFAGTCSWNASRDTFIDATLPLHQRLKRMLGPKGLPLASWKVLTKRHSGSFWFVYWLWPYSRVIIESIITKMSLSRLRS